MDLTGLSGKHHGGMSCTITNHPPTADPYVKIYLVHDGQRIAKKKTHIKKRSLNPVFNESFVFDLPDSDGDLSSSQLEFVVLDWDRVTKNEVLATNVHNLPTSFILLEPSSHFLFKNIATDFIHFLFFLTILVNDSPWCEK